MTRAQTAVARSSVFGVKIKPRLRKGVESTTLTIKPSFSFHAPSFSFPLVPSYIHPHRQTPINYPDSVETRLLASLHLRPRESGLSV